MLFLHFLWVSGSLKVVLNFIAPHLLLVTIKVQNLTQQVITVVTDKFTFTFNVIEAFADGGANLVSRRVITIWLKQVTVSRI